MKNLAGETKADLYILEELDKAGIEIVEGTRSKSEVPQTLTGKLGNWKFTRAWYYWMANASDETGLPLEVATELHNRKYPIEGEQEPRHYGQVIRVAGHCGCPPPSEWAKHYDAQGLRLVVDPKGKQEAKWKSMVERHPYMKQDFEKYRFVPSLDSVVAKSIVNSYHIDTQEGLNAFAGAIRTLHNMASSGTDPEKIKQLHDKISALYVQWETEQQQDGVEWLKKLPTIAYDGRTVTELIVAIKDESEVVSIGKKWKDNQHERKGIAQHFFEDGRITGFNYGNISGPGQILNRGPEIDEKLRPHYEELMILRPKAAYSLDCCMQELEKPGPEYKK